MAQTHPHEQASPYQTPQWPLRAGFTYLPGRRVWRSADGKYELHQVSTKYWLVKRTDAPAGSPADARLTTLARDPETIASDLLVKLLTYLQEAR